MIKPHDSSIPLIFSGTSHPYLARKIAKHLGMELSPSKLSRFSNDNLLAHLGVSVRAKDVYIVQSISPPCSEHLMELLLMLDVARSAGAKSVHAVVPYYSYARSDKKDAPRISIAARLIADLLVTAGANHIITMTLHSPQVHGFFSIPADHLTAHSVFVQYLQQQDLSNSVVVSPDIGHAKRAAKLARALGLPIAAAEKIRMSDDSVEIGGIMGDVRGKRAILVDDEIATGGSMITTIDHLRMEQVTQVTIIVTHGLFTGPAIERLNAVEEIDEIVVTNTVDLPPDRRPERLRILSVAHIFGEAIKRHIEGESIGALFEFWPST
ncbi:MAG: ribose-phosphate pyrophosphokinase [Chloroflexota bacterium]